MAKYRVTNIAIQQFDPFADKNRMSERLENKLNELTDEGAEIISVFESEGVAQIIYTNHDEG